MQQEQKTKTTEKQFDETTDKQVTYWSNSITRRRRGRKI